MSYNVIGDIMRHFLLKFSIIILIFSLLCQMPVFALSYYYDGANHEYTAPPVELIVNNEVIVGDMPPIILNDRTMVPAYFVFSALGADVTWLSRTRQVQITYDGTEILLTIDSREVKLDNHYVYIRDTDPPAKIVNDRTMIPLRFVAECLGMEVFWVNSTRTVIIATPIPTPSPTPAPTAAPTIKPTTAPTARPTATPTQAPLTGKINSVTYTNHQILLKGTNLHQPKVTKVGNPTRFVFDIEDATFLTGDKNYTYNDAYVTAIRYANHPTYARLVIKPKEGTSYTYQASATEMRITLNQSATSSVGASPAPTQVPTATTTAPTVTPSAEPRKQNARPIVVLDAGHGGTDPGALGRNDEGEVVANEKDVNFAITMKVYRKLKSSGIDTYLTRDSDTYITLAGRSTYANSINADIFVSIHSNAVENTSVNGMMVMYNPSSAPTKDYFTYSTQMAEFVSNRLKEGTDLKNLGLRDGSGLWVIRKTAMPAILVECAFITNESDREKLTDDAYQDRIAQCIYLGILDTLDQAK